MVQLGPQPGLVVEEREGKGRGLVTSYSLMEGQFVCEYAGEVIGEEVARRRTSRQTRSEGCLYVFPRPHVPLTRPSSYSSVWVGSV